MSRIKFTDLNIGDTFALHTIKFAHKIDNAYIRGQIKYVRTRLYTNTDMDEVDELIFNAVNRKYPRAKHIASIEVVENKQKSKYKKSTVHLCGFDINMRIVKNEHLDFNNPFNAYITTECSFPISIFCESTFQREFNDDLEIYIYNGDYYVQEITATINSTLMNFEQFFL